MFSLILSHQYLSKRRITGKVNLITVSLNPHTQITASVKTQLQNTFMLTTVDYYQKYLLIEQLKIVSDTTFGSI